MDGYVARRFDQVTTLGKVLDPVADRLLFFVGVGGIIVVGARPALVLLGGLAREVSSSVAVVVLALLGAKRIDVTWYGKAGTFLLMFAFPLFLAGSSVDLERADLRGPRVDVRGPRPGPRLLRGRALRAHRAAGARARAVAPAP